MDTSELVIHNNNEKLIVCFGAFALKMGDIPSYDFLNFITTHFPQVDKIFYRDLKQMCYHHGIEKLSDSVETTVAYLKEKIANYKKVIFTGTSAGAYAAMLYGSLLNVTDVIAFNPITILYGRRDKYNLRYVDLAKDVINSTTNYYLFGDVTITNEKDFHHIKHCKNIGHYPNVKIIYKKGIDLSQMKKNGELRAIYNAILLR
jgi:hypothetical protein